MHIIFLKSSIKLLLLLLLFIIIIIIIITIIIRHSSVDWKWEVGAYCDLLNFILDG